MKRKIGLFERLEDRRLLAVCAPVPDGIISWWPANGSAEDIADGNDGAAHKDAAFTPGKVGQAFSLDGVDDFVEINDNPNLTPASMTFAAWVYPESTTGVKVIASKYDSDDQVNGGLSWVLDVEDGHVEFGVYGFANGVIGRVIEATSVLTEGVWSHVAGTFDAATQDINIYINGDAVAHNFVLSGNVAIRDTGTPVLIGAFAGTVDSELVSSAFWDGGIDEATLYNRALGASEIFGIFNADSAGKCGAAAADIVVLHNGTEIADGTIAAIDFGTVVQGSVAPMMTFTVQNVGDATLTLGENSSANVIVPPGFTLIEDVSTFIAPGEQDTFIVQIDSAAAGPKAGQISFVTNDEDETAFNFPVVAGVTLAPVPFQSQQTPFDSTYDLGFINNSLVMHLEIQLVGADPGNLPQIWENGAEHKWNNNTFFVCDGVVLSGSCNGIEYHMVLDVAFVDRGADVVVTVHEGDSTTDNEADMENWFTGSPAGWGVERQGDFAAHEVGHMLGLYDEYPDGYFDPNNPNPFFLNTGSGGGFCTLDANGLCTFTSESIMGSLDGSPQQRHYEHFLSWLNERTNRNMVLGRSPLYSQRPPSPPPTEGTPGVTPDAPMNIDLLPESDTGRFDTDDFTADDTPVFQVEAETGLTVDIYVNGTFAVAADETISGVYQITLPSGHLQVGSNSIAATASTTTKTSDLSEGLDVVFAIPSRIALHRGQQELRYTQPDATDVTVTVHRRASAEIELLATDTVAEMTRANLVSRGFGGRFSVTAQGGLAYLPDVQVDGGNFGKIKLTNVSLGNLSAPKSVKSLKLLGTGSEIVGTIDVGHDVWNLSAKSATLGGTILVGDDLKRATIGTALSGSRIEVGDRLKRLRFTHDSTVNIHARHIGRIAASGCLAGSILSDTHLHTIILHDDSDLDVTADRIFRVRSHGVMRGFYVAERIDRIFSDDDLLATLVADSIGIIRAPDL